MNFRIKLKQASGILKINCFRFDGNGFDKNQDSKYSHWNTALGSYQGRPFVTGGRWNNVKTEILSTSSLKWESAPDYPFAGVDYRGRT